MKKEKITTNTMLMYEALKKSHGEEVAREAVDEITKEKLFLRALGKFLNCNNVDFKDN